MFNDSRRLKTIYFLLIVNHFLSFNLINNIVELNEGQSLSIIGLSNQYV